MVALIIIGIIAVGIICLLGKAASAGDFTPKSNNGLYGDNAENL